MEIQNRIHHFLTRGRSWNQRNSKAVQKITVHHSAHTSLGTFEKDLQFIYNVHSGQGWPGLSYHFVIGKDGTVAQTNNLSDITWHDAINSDSIGILVVGYFHAPRNEKPTEAQLLSLKALLNRLCRETPEIPADHDDVLGHRERSSTACPGDFLQPYITNYRTKKGSVEWGGGIEPGNPAKKAPVHVNEKASFFDRIVNHEHKAGSLKTNRSEDYTDVDITQLIDGLRADKKTLEEDLRKANVKVGYLHRIYTGLMKLGILHTDRSEDLNDKIVLEQVAFSLTTIKNNQKKDEEVNDSRIEELESENNSLKETIKHHGSELETQRKSYENLISRNEERHKEEIKTLELKPEIVNAEKTLDELSELREKVKQLDNPVMQFFLKVVTFFERQ